MRLAVPLVGAGVAVSLGLGLLVGYGAHAADPVTPAEALARYRAAPRFPGLPGWDRPLGGTRPAPGVYTYATTGSAGIDRLGVERRHPATTTRVVTHGPGCQWRETLLVLDEHVETHSACATADDQVETGFGVRLVHVFRPTVLDLECGSGGTRTGAGLREGASRTFGCRDDARDVRVEGTVTYLGEGTASVTGVRVRCRQVRVLLVLSGTVSGTAVRELCVDGGTGLVLAETREVGVVATGRFGRVRYAETATFELSSVSPRA